MQIQRIWPRVLAAFLLVAALVPVGMGVAFAEPDGAGSESTEIIENPATPNEDSTAEPSAEGDQSVDGEMGDSSGDSQPDGAAGQQAADGEAAGQDAESETPAAGEASFELFEDIASGTLANDWQWKLVSGEEGGETVYKLTFEYTGTADPVPALAIPENFIEGIAEDLGENKDKITKIEVPEGVTTIGANAFKDMPALEDVELPKTLTAIGDAAFMGCNKLETVNLENTKIKDASKSMFQNCSSLKGVKFPSTLTRILADAFNGCSSLKTADFSDVTGLTVIRANAFRDSGLESIDIPDSITSIQASVFEGCKSLKTASMPALSYLNSNLSDEKRLFANCPALEELTFRPVNRGTSSNRYNLPDQTLIGDSSLKKLDLSGYSNYGSGFRIQDNSTSLKLFGNNDLSKLEEIVLPTGTSVTIGNGVFSGKTGLKDLDVFTNPQSVTSIGTSAFENSGLTKADLSGWTNSSLTTIPESSFANCKNLSEVVIPSNITTLGKQAFANDPELKSVTVNSKKLTSVDKTVFDGTGNDMTITIGKDVEQLTANFFVVAPESAKIKFEGESIIKIDPATYSGGLRPLKDLEGTYWVTEEGVLYKLDDDGTASLAYVPDDLESYTVPETLTTTTDAGVPGNTYTVDRMKAHAVHHAPSLTSLTFESPQNIVIEPTAFTGRSTMTDAKGLLVNGASEIDPDDFAQVSIICDYPLKSDVTGNNLVPSITSTIEDSDGKEIARTIVVVSEKTPGDDDIYHYKTGEEATYTIAITNEDNIAMSSVVRVYVSYDNSGQNMGAFPPGEYTLINPVPPNNKYPVKVVETGTKGIYYYEISGIQPGETLAFNNTTFYPSPNTSGGTLHIWTTTLTPEEAEAKAGRLINPTDYMQLEWTTTPVVYDLAKDRSYVWGYPNGTSSSGVNQTASIKVNNAGEATVSNLAFLVRERNHEGSSATTQGSDYIRWVQYEDIVDLPAELSWRPEVIEAIKKGAGSSGGSDGWWIENGSTNVDYSWYSTTGTVSTRVVKVRAGGSVYDLAHIYGRNTSPGNILGVTPEIVEVDGVQKLKLTWRVNNPASNQLGSAENEYPIQQFYLRFGDNVILADVDAVNDLFDEHPDATESPLQVHNDASERRHYSYSPVQTAEDDASDPVDANAGMDVTKFWNSSSGSYVRGGTYDSATIRISNTGIMSIDQWGSLVQATDEDGNPVKDEQGNPVYEKDAKGRNKTDGRIVTDTLPTMHFIEPGNIEAMLNATTTAGSGGNAQTVPIGDWLTITITKATLCTPGQYQPVDGTDQNNKYTVGNNSNIQAASDQGARVKEGASFTITKTDEGVITVTLAGDTIAENNKTYTVGDGGDYATIEDLFDAVGFFPTRNTTYGLTYDAPEGFTLKAGQILNFDLKTTLKTTPMMLTTDTRNYSGSYGSNSRNTATVKANVGGTLVTRSPQTGYRYWDRELFFYKNGYAEGSNTQLSGSEIKVDQGTILDFYLNGYTSGNTRLYEHQLLSDYMDGAMVVLAPVAQNPDLTAPDGSTLETYTSGSATYWLLNKPGTYENVKLGSTSRTGAPTYETRTLEVSETVSGGKRTSLATFIQWQPWENWGTGSSTTARVYYKVLVSAAEAGLTSDEGDENDSFSINNKAWLGDHQGHRLWDWLIGEYQVYGTNKHIVDPENGKGDGTDTTAADGGLIDYSRVHVGETVTYQMEIDNLTPVPTKLTGKSLRDALPDTYGVFAWTRGDDATPANVTNLRYIASDGVTITAGTGDDKVNLDTHGGTNPNDTYWSIVPSTKSRQHRDGSTITTLSRNGGYDINWSDDFTINFSGHGTVKVLVDVTFPTRPVDGASTWDQYVAKVRGEELYNTFYVNGLWDEVSHTLEATGKPVLYKGVYDTGLTTHGTGTNSYSASYTSNNSRFWYANGAVPASYSDEDLKVETVTYYTVLYNGSFDRMYLSDLQDQLPRGFTFNTMQNYCYGVTDLTYSSWPQYGYVGYASPSGTRSTTNTEYPSESYKPVAIIDNGTVGLDAADKPKLRYVNALVTASTSTGEDGRQHITFKVGNPNYTNSSYRNIHYDPVVKKYYLNPGEALRFGYNVLVPEYAKTDDHATNTVAMPYYDYYGTDFNLHVPNENGEGGALPKVRANTGAKANDGGCQTMTSSQVEGKFGMDASAYQDELYNNHEGGNWLVSSATVERAPMTPGIQKSVGGTTVRVENPTATTIQGSTGNSPSTFYGKTYTGGAMSSDIVNWRLRVFSEAGAGDDGVPGTMTGYSVVDTVDAPYGFTGQVFYNMYKAVGSSRQTRNSQYLFTLGSRSEGDTSVRISTGGGLSASGWRMLGIGSAEDDSDDDWFQFGTGTKSGKVKIERNAEGKEVMTIRLDGTAYSIPGGFWADFCVHTQYASNDTPISEGKYNDSVLWPDQDYDPADVAQGRARTKEQYKDDGTIETVNDGVQSGASIMLSMGFTTASWKTIAELNASGSPTGAKARSDDSPNYVTLDEKHNPFRYDLYMVGPTRVMAKIVFIDDLPQEGDHSAFVEADKRNSEFTVGFWADNPDFAVTIAPKQGGAEKKLDPGQYQIQVTDRTEFTTEDWNGEGDGWTDITNAGAEERAAALWTARSFRIVIEDENAWQNTDRNKWLMNNECQIHISFNAIVDDPAAKPGQYAWNGFGYRYTVPLVFNMGSDEANGLKLEAQPLNVGVRIPSAPSLEKKLTELAQAMETKVIEVERQAVDEETGEPLFDENGDPIMETVEEEVTEPATTPVLDEDGNPVTDADGNPVTEPVMEHAAHKAAMDLDFGFIVYEGNPIAELDNALEMTNADIAAALGDRKYIYVPLKVEEGKSSAKANLWEWEFTAAYDEETDSFKTVEVTDDSGAKKPNWYWKDGTRYTVVELPIGDYDYKLLTLQTAGVPQEKNNVAFDNTSSRIIPLIGTNEWGPEYTSVTGTKVWKDAGNQDGVRPSEVVVRLLADGEEVDSRTVTAGTGWKWEFTNLLVNNEDGTPIVYQTTEDAVDDYSATVETVKDNPYDFKVTNTHTPGKTSVSVSKVWDDGDNADGFRPRSVTIHLLANGKDTGKKLKLTSANNWMGTFTGLDMRKDGKDLRYTVTEDEVDSYTTVISGDAKKGYVVTNMHMTSGSSGMDGDSPCPDCDNGKNGKKSKLAKAGDEAPLGLLLLLVGAGAVALAASRKTGRSRRES